MHRNSSDRDENLVLQIQSGNYNEFPKLVKQWHKEFCNKAYWLTKDAELSKDIAQDSWRTIIEKISDLKDPKSFKSWALRIVYSKSLDALRANQRQQNELQSYAYRITEDDKEIIDNSDLKKRLYKAVNGLSEQQQMVIKLFYVEDYSLKQISKLLNISTGTVKSRLFHAREKLKSIIKN